MADYIPAVLTGDTKPKNIKRSICAEGHKAMFNSEYGGLPLFMQIYSDVLGLEIKVAMSSQTCALGAAIFGAVCAGKDKSDF